YLRAAPVPFDVIFVAPPQWHGLWPRAFTLLDRHPGWLADGAVAVAQHDPSESVPLDLAHLELVDERTYGRVRFSFFAAQAAGGARPGRTSRTPTTWRPSTTRPRSPGNSTASRSTGTSWTATRPPSPGPARSGTLAAARPAT